MARESVVFTTEEGVGVKLVAVRQVTLDLAAAKIIDEFRQRGEPIDVPTYEVKSIAGETMTFKHEQAAPAEVDESGNVTKPASPGTLDVPNDPEETALRHALWRRYEDALTRLNLRQFEERYKALMFFGIHVEIPPDSEWLEQQREFGLPDPKDPIERKIRYISTELCSARDLGAMLSMLQMLIGGRSISEKEIKEYEGLFRRAMAGTSSFRVELALNQLRRLVGEPEAVGTADSDGVGDTPTG